MESLLDILPLFVVVLSGFAVFQTRFDTIDPNMRSNWFFMHIGFFALAYAFFTAGSVAGILFLKETSLAKQKGDHLIALFFEETKI